MKKIIIFLLLISILANSQTLVTPPSGTTQTISNLDFQNKKGVYNSFFVNTTNEKVTTAQMNAIILAQAGRNVFNTTTNSNWYYNGTAWVNSSQTPFINSVSLPLSVNTQNLSIATANSTTSGIINFNDWNVFNNKQDLLVSNSNIKTINSISILGSGNIPFPIQQNSDWNAITGVTQILNKPLIQAPITATAPLSFNSGTATISIPESGLVTSGFLATADFVNFSNKLQTANNGLTATGTLIELGGTLTKNTNLAGNFNLTTSGTGNVGIGTNTPTAKLDVNGGGLFGVQKSTLDAGFSVGANILNTSAPTKITTTAITTPETALRLFSTGTNIVKFNPSIDFQIGTYAAGINAFTKLNIRLGNGSTHTPDTDVMSLQGNGNVGIGTNTPTAKLEVVGQIKITGGTPAVGKVLTTDATGLATWENTQITLSWVDYANRWDSEPTTVATIASGEVLSYIWKGVTRFRLIPTVYSPTTDGFYANFNGTVLSNLITNRNN